MFAVMHDTDYAAKAKFVENFWNDWKNILGEDHVIQGFEGCDFTPIYNWYIGEKEKKKQMTTEVYSLLLIYVGCCLKIYLYRTFHILLGI